MTGTSGRIPPTPDDDHNEMMALFRTLPDEEVDDLLAGRSTASDAVDGLVDVVAVLRADAHRHGAPQMRGALRRQINAPAPAAPGTSRRRRRLVAGGVLGILFGTSAIGAASAQNVLPASLLDAASSAAGFVGIDIPRAAERDVDDDAPAGVGGEDTGGTADGSAGTDAPHDAGSGASSTRGEGTGPSTPTGPNDTTPAGAVPADPATPGDEGPATQADPASPPSSSGQGAGAGAGGGSNQGNSASENDASENDASETGQENGSARDRQ